MTSQTRAVLSHWQRKLARQVKFSNSWRITAKRIAKIHAGIANRRKHFAHKESKRVVEKYDAIGLETHSLKNQTARFGKSVSDAGHAMFRSFIDYKAADLGKQVVKMTEFFKSTGVCPCGYSTRLTLSIRNWTCPVCGRQHHRDIAAAETVQRETVKQLTANEM